MSKTVGEYRESCSEAVELAESLRRKSGADIITAVKSCYTKYKDADEFYKEVFKEVQHIMIGYMQTLDFVFSNEKAPVLAERKRYETTNRDD